MKRIYLVAGEESGDIHGANLIRALQDQSPGVHCEGLGGQRMAEAGMMLHYDLAGDAIMGFTEVVRKFPGIRRLFLGTLKHITQTRPDALVLIDYPGFNIRLAKRVSTLGIPVIFYISPQVWAWKKKRIHTLAKFVNKILVIFPFEKALYETVGLDCAYVGHPLLDHIGEYKRIESRGNHNQGESASSFPRTWESRTRQDTSLDPRVRGDNDALPRPCHVDAQHASDNTPIIGLLPGSREQEIKRLLAPMLEVAQGIRETHPNARFITPVVNEARGAQAKEIAGNFPLNIQVGGMYELLANARFCMVASGTATLETALFGVPMLIMYKVTPVTYWIAKFFVDIQHIGIVNILAGREIVPEYIQGDIQPAKILPKALSLINPGTERTQMLSDLQEVHAMLGDGGASDNAAREILTTIHGVSHA